MKPLPLLSLCVLVLVGSLAASDAVRAETGGSELFPRPAELEPDIAFWRRVYTEVEGDGGLIHDSRHLGVVYEVVHFPAGASNRTRERLVEKRKKHYAAVLRALSRGKRSGLDPEEAQILALWGEDASDSQLRKAASRLRFQLGQADKFRAGLMRSGAWRDHIRRTFRQMGLPEELAALPHVESSFTPHAWSRVGAAGLWQFTRSTGRRYMRVDHVVDERLDPIKATIAAARLLEHNHRATGTWPLALTAYNHGAAGMRRASRKMGTTDIAVINRRYRSRTFGFASRNFYVEFLAALEIDQDPERFFGPLAVDSPPEVETIELPYFASASGLARALDIDVATLRRHNPALRDSVWSGAKRVPKGFELRVPRGRLEKPLETLIAEVPDAARFASQTRDTYHTIQRGETLSGIAARYEVSLSELASLNGLRSRHRIRAGQRLRLPEDATGRPSPRAPRIAQAPPEASAKGTYRVRSGDTLERIARVFGVSERDLLGWNQIRNPNRIAVGQTLRVQDVPDDGEPAIVASEPVVVASVQPDHPDLVAAFTPPPGARADFGADSGADAEPDEPLLADLAAPGIATGDEDLAANDAEPLAEDTDAADEADEGDDAAEGGSDATIGASVADAAAAELAQGSPAAEMLLADPGDYSVASDGTIEIQAAETLGHYAEWLDVRASRLRAINHMRYGTPLAIGARLKLDLSRVSPQLFEQRRADHHRTLQGEFFDRYEIEGTATHVVRRGDSIWQLAERRYDVPLWLVRQYNPDVDFADLHTGEHLTIPVLHEK